MTCRKAVCRAVEAYIKLCSAEIDKVAYFRFVRDLRDKSARLSFFVNLHFLFSFLFIWGQKNVPCVCRGRKFRVTTSIRLFLAGQTFAGFV